MTPLTMAELDEAYRRASRGELAPVPRDFYDRALCAQRTMLAEVRAGRVEYDELKRYRARVAAVLDMRAELVARRAVHNPVPRPLADTLAPPEADLAEAVERMMAGFRAQAVLEAGR